MHHSALTPTEEPGHRHVRPRPCGRRPHTAVVAAGRTNGPGQPLNVPLVLASTFRATPKRTRPTESKSGREYSRDDGTQTWEALEQVIGELESGHAVAFSSGVAAAAAVFDLLPAGSRIVAPTDCYSGVKALLADGQEQGVGCELVDVTDTEVSSPPQPTPTCCGWSRRQTHCSRSPTCLRSAAPGGTVGR